MKKGTTLLSHNVRGTELKITIENGGEREAYTHSDGWTLSKKPTEIIEVGQEGLLLHFADNHPSESCLWIGWQGKEVIFPYAAYIEPELIRPAKANRFCQAITPAIVSQASILYGKNINRYGHLFAVDLDFENWEKVFNTWMETVAPEGKKSIAEFIRKTSQVSTTSTTMFPDNEKLYDSSGDNEMVSMSFELLFQFQYMKGWLDLGTLGKIRSDIQYGPHLICSGSIGLNTGAEMFPIYTFETSKIPRLVSIANGLIKPLAYRL